MTSRKSIGAILATLFLAFLLATAMVLSAASAPADRSKLEVYLEGKWHQEYGPYVTETVLLRTHTFTSITVQPGTPYHLYVQGDWEIRAEDELWMTWREWEPHTIARPLPEGSRIEIIDQDHFRNKLGVVTRMKQ